MKKGANALGWIVGAVIAIIAMGIMIFIGISGIWEKGFGIINLFPK